MWDMQVSTAQRSDAIAINHDRQKQKSRPYGRLLVSAIDD